jgi:hypothetical protein
METLIRQTLQKAVPESLFRLTDFAVRILAGFFSKPLVYRESGFRKLFCKSNGGFQSAGHDHEHTFILISGLPKGFSHS